MGTELLLRYVPKIDMGTNIGKFSFYGIGLKHSLSQYFNQSENIEKRYFDLAIQAVYQRTSLNNRLSTTNTEFQTDANIWDVNLHASKNFKDLFEIYVGFSYENLVINSKYTYYLPIEVQWQLGLLDQYHPKPSPGYPGDQNPQYAELELKDINYKFVFGINKQIGPFCICLDYNISKFNIFTGGVMYNF